MDNYKKRNWHNIALSTETHDAVTEVGTGGVDAGYKLPFDITL